MHLGKSVHLSICPTAQCLCYAFFHSQRTGYLRQICKSLKLAQTGQKTRLNAHTSIRPKARIALLFVSFDRYSSPDLIKCANFLFSFASILYRKRVMSIQDSVGAEYNFLTTIQIILYLEINDIHRREKVLFQQPVSYQQNRARIYMSVCPLLAVKLGWRGSILATLVIKCTTWSI